MQIVKVGVVGSRRRDTIADKIIVRNAIKYLMKKDPEVTIHLVSGGCPLGADRFAEEVAEELGLNITIHYPDKSKLEAQERWAYAKINFARNTLIAEDCDMLVALPAPDRTGGTENTIATAKKIGKSVVLL